MAHTFPLDLDQILQRLPQDLEAVGVPGLVMSLITENRVVATYAFGVKSTASKQPMTADTVFQAASLSKPVFASAVIGLYEDGIIDQSGTVILTNGSGGLKLCERIVCGVTGHEHAAFLWL